MMLIMSSIKCYSELIEIPTFMGRYRYLKLDGIVGEETFGYDRYLNQILYTSPEWRRFRRYVIMRDQGCDLAHEEYEIPDGVKILIHHINPITLKDVERRDPKIFDLENVISTVLVTHNAIHYGDETLLLPELIERTPYDTCPWKLHSERG